MNKYARKIITAALIVCMAVVIVIGFMKSGHLLPTDNNLWNNSSSSSPSDCAQSDTNQSVTSTSSSSSSLSWREKTATVCDLIFTVQKAEISKDTGGLPTPDILYEGQTMNTNGTLTSAHSYVRITVTIQNIASEETVLSLNNHYIHIYDHGEPLDGGSLMTMDVNQSQQNTREYYHYTLQSGEHQSFQLGFIVADRLLRKDYDILHYPSPWGQTGSPTGNPNLAYIRLNDFIAAGALA